MRKRSERRDDQALIENLIGLGDFSARKSYYPELQRKIDELEAEKDRYKWLFENALHGIFQASVEGVIRNANPAIARILGFASPEQLREQINDLSTELFDDPEDYRRLMKLLARSGKHTGFETRLITRQGLRVDVSMNVLLKDEGLIEVFVQDITERKKAQRELTRLNAELEGRVADRTRELSRVNRHLMEEIKERREIEVALSQAKQEAEEANRSKDRYLAAASHDLLQPMNAARLMVTSLQEHLLQRDDPHIAPLAERIHLALQGAEELLTDLLDIAKLDANAVAADPVPLRLNDLLQALATEFEPLARQAGLKLRVQPTQAVIESDRRLLMRVLRNLLSNALRYTESGSILIGCRRHGAQLDIWICDTGPGISTSDQGKIFAEFRQLDNRIQGRDKGVGLGLAIVDRIARVLHHEILLRSSLGKGSCFGLRVPRCAQPTLATATPPIYPPTVDTVRGSCVLVVENDPQILTSMAELLTLWGCDVHAALSITEAKAKIQDCQCRPDILLADYHLDGQETGDQAIMQLREQLNEQIPAFIITADRSNEVRAHLEALGIIRLNKPVKPGKLRALMSHELARGDGAG